MSMARRSNVHCIAFPAPALRLSMQERAAAELRMLMAFDGLSAWERVTYAGKLAGLLIRLDADDRFDSPWTRLL